MKKNLIAFYLSLLAASALPLGAQAAAFNTPTDVSIAPTLSHDTLQQLPWRPIVPPASERIEITASSPQVNQGDIQGSVAAFTLPADRGSLEITLDSLVNDRSVYSPSVVVLDEQLRPAAFYPSSYFAYKQAGVMSGDRLEGTMKLTPALGQKQIYLLVYTTRQDLAATTQLLDPAKAYALGVGNAAPNIPDPIAHHSSTGALNLKVKSEQNMGSVMIGLPMTTSTAPAPVVVGSATPAVAAAPVAAPAPAAPAEPMLNDTEAYFNNGIKQAVKAGDIDKALKLMNEAEKLGSTTARETFIGSVKGKG
ncbi:maltose-binding protein [Chania multitudinisentens RB-25]|uniref:Maltose-binding protein n=1 Tax=Chania multitudinisentens RB-25 TaxID=1441930 RepID=W0LBT5_9GAMM|nr:maltose operon protein MalM [Chania multitudinisentens]AHG19854.1 maltose-binding protein [Chania multitudinisentens RB-25]